MKTTLKGIFLFVLLIPSIAQAYTESFYISATGTCTSACESSGDPGSVAYFNSSGNWGTDVSNDGLIGPDDLVYLLDDGGAYTSQLTVKGSGTSGNVITIMPAPGDTVEFRPTSNTAFSTGGQDYITLDCNDNITLYADTSITADHSIVQAAYSEYVTINGCTVDGSTNVEDPPSGGARAINIGGSGGNNYTVTNNTISKTSLGIVWFAKSGAGDDNFQKVGTVSGNTISYMDMDSSGDTNCGGCDCIGMGSSQYEANADFSGVIIEKNHVSQCMDDGIDTFTTIGTTIRYNEVGPATSESHTLTAIKIGINTLTWGRDIKVYGNYVHDWTSSSQDTYGINTNGGGGGSKIYSNLIVNVGTVGIRIGNQADSPGETLIYNNTVVCESENRNGISLDNNDNDDIYIRNNIVEGPCTDNAIGVGSTNSANVHGGYNILSDFASANNGSGTYIGSADDLGNTDPDFFDAANRKYWVQAGSPARDAGTHIDVPSDKALLPGSVWPTDVVAVDPYMDGTQREIGAYAYGGNTGNTPVDNCPSDPSKTQPGLCGCGVSDADSDSDGIPDCNDNCPNDPGNDVDGDEVCAYDDNCPTVSNANQADSDGDGIGDACDPFPNESDHEKGQLKVDLAQAQTDLAQAQAELSQSQSDFNQCSTSLYQCDSDLSQSEADMAQAQAELSQSQSDFNQCSTSLYQCDSDLSQSEADMAQCTADLSQCESDFD